jgi:hypothetical protein
VCSLRTGAVVVASKKPVAGISGCGLNCRDCVLVRVSPSGSSGDGKNVGVGVSSKPVTDTSGCGFNFRDCVLVRVSMSCGSVGRGEAVGVGATVGIV